MEKLAWLMVAPVLAIIALSVIGLIIVAGAVKILVVERRKLSVSAPGKNMYKKEKRNDKKAR